MNFSPGTPLAELGLGPLSIIASNGAPVSPEVQAPIMSINAENSGSHARIVFSSAADPATSGLDSQKAEFGMTGPKAGDFSFS